MMKRRSTGNVGEWEWRQQTCVMSSVQKCKELYGLGVDCDYRIVSVKDLDKEGKS